MISLGGAHAWLAAAPFRNVNRGNVEEAQAGQSKPDFISKNAIALKEARETSYWLRLLAASKIVPMERLVELQNEASELAKIIGAIIVSAKKRK